MDEYNIKFISEEQVTDELDTKLRDLLVHCFPETAHIFSKQRFYHEPPQYRWCIFGENDSLIAHVALHIKKVKTEFTNYDMGGIAEVCVHSDYRRQGITRMLLKQILDYLRERNIVFAMLFGDTSVYSSSGFKQLNNKIRYFDQKSEEWKIEKDPSAMYLELGQVNWPEGNVDICGPTF